MKIGIDIGGSHIGIGVVDENGRIIDKVETFIKDKSDIEEKIEKYLKKYPSIKYLEKENGGLSDARNYGMPYATGEYIAFLDSDDYVESTMYEDM